MSTGFVPFAPPTGAAPEPPADSFRLTVLPRATEAAPFVPSAPATTHACALPAASGPAGNMASPEGPEVTYEREGDRVTRIRVRCGCGQILELNLLY